MLDDLIIDSDIFLNKSKSESVWKSFLSDYKDASRKISSLIDEYPEDIYIQLRFIQMSKRSFAQVPFDVLSFNSFLFRSFSDKSFNSPPNDFSDIVMGKAPKQLQDLKLLLERFEIYLEVIDLLSQFSERINKTFGDASALKRRWNNLIQLHLISLMG